MSSHINVCVFPAIPLDPLELRHSRQPKQTETLRHTDDIEVLYSENIRRLVFRVCTDKRDERLRCLRG